MIMERKEPVDDGKPGEFRYMTRGDVHLWLDTLMVLGKLVKVWSSPPGLKFVYPQSFLYHNHYISLVCHEGHSSLRTQRLLVNNRVAFSKNRREYR